MDETADRDRAAAAAAGGPEGQGAGEGRARAPRQGGQRDRDGRPDQIGAALLKSVGLYPPGSFVQLVNGETGIVVARGKQANLPMVAVLRSQTGVPLVSPSLRDTADKRHAVKCGVGVEAVNVLPPHDRLVAMR